MAKAPAHKFGQIVGNMLESIIYPFLKELTDKHHHYLDRAGARYPARSGKKVSWLDKYENTHDLDFVIEYNGSKERKGRPLAFIEAAWRRYTKHSRNKAQEIQGAILPIAERHSWDAPFLGVIIAGIFTEGSIKQMESSGFQVLYFPYESIISAFSEVGINCRFDEDTSNDSFQSCVDTIEALPKDSLAIIENTLVSINRSAIDAFLSELEKALTRTIIRIVVSPLFGKANEFTSVDTALVYLDSDFEKDSADDLVKIEILVTYSNSDRIEGSFTTSNEAKRFLEYAKLRG